MTQNQWSVSSQVEVKKYSALGWIEDLFIPFLMEKVIESCSQNKNYQLHGKLQEEKKRDRSVSKSQLEKLLLLLY